MGDNVGSYTLSVEHGKTFDLVLDTSLQVYRFVELLLPYLFRQPLGRFVVL